MLSMGLLGGVVVPAPVAVAQNAPQDPNLHSSLNTPLLKPPSGSGSPKVVRPQIKTKYTDYPLYQYHCKADKRLYRSAQKKYVGNNAPSGTPAPVKETVSISMIRTTDVQNLDDEDPLGFLDVITAISKIKASLQARTASLQTRHNVPMFITVGNPAYQSAPTLASAGFWIHKFDLEVVGEAAIWPSSGETTVPTGTWLATKPNGDAIDLRCFSYSSEYTERCLAKALLVRFYGTYGNPAETIVASWIYPQDQYIANNSLSRYHVTDCKTNQFAWMMPYPADSPGSGASKLEFWEELVNAGHVSFPNAGTGGLSAGDLVIPRKDDRDGLPTTSREVWLLKCATASITTAACSSVTQVLDSLGTPVESLPPPTGTGCLQPDNEPKSLTNPAFRAVELAEWKRLLGTTEQTILSQFGSGDMLLDADGSRLLLRRMMNMLTITSASDPIDDLTDDSEWAAPNFPDSRDCSSGWDFYGVINPSGTPTQGQTPTQRTTRMQLGDPVYGSCIIPVHKRIRQKNMKNRQSEATRLGMNSVDDLPDRNFFDKLILDTEVLTAFKNQEETALENLFTSNPNSPYLDEIKDVLKAYGGTIQKILEDASTDPLKPDFGLLDYIKNAESATTTTYTFHTAGKTDFAKLDIPCRYGALQYSVAPPKNPTGGGGGTPGYIGSVSNAQVTVGSQHTGGNLTMYTIPPDSSQMEAKVIVIRGYRGSTATSVAGEEVCGLTATGWCYIENVTYDPQLKLVDDKTAAITNYPGTVCSAPADGCDYAIAPPQATGTYTDSATKAFTARMWFFVPTGEDESLVLDVNPTITIRTKYWEYYTAWDFRWASYWDPIQKVWVNYKRWFSYIDWRIASKRKTITTGSSEMEQEVCGDLFKVATRRLTDSRVGGDGAAVTLGPPITYQCFTK